MESKRQKKIGNVLMIFAICAVLVLGLFAVGTVKGWFGQAESTGSCVSVSGLANVERSGVAYTLEEGAVLQAGDIISTQQKAQVQLELSEGNLLTLDEKTKLKVNACEQDSVQLELLQGLLFAEVADAGERFELLFAGNKANITGTVFSLDHQTGSSNLNVYEGSVAVTDVAGTNHAVAAGSAFGSADHADGSVSSEVSVLRCDALSNFLLEKMEQCTVSLCFSAEEVTAVLESRTAQKDVITLEKEEAKKEETEETTELPETEATVTETPVTEAPTTETPAQQPAETPVTTPIETPVETPVETPTETPKAEQEEKPEEDDNELVIGGDGDEDEWVETEKEEEEKKPAEEKPKEEEESSSVMTCTISIRCDTILNNMDELNPAKQGFVPSNGKILGKTTVEFEAGETVFDVLTRVCDEMGISLEYSYTPVYESYYIEGINNLYEFDCGGQSGWMYAVNGWYPNYGCSAYELEDGDSITWAFTCKGYGDDL